MACRKSLLGVSDDNNSSSVMGGSAEDCRISVLGGSNEDNSRSMLVGSAEDYSRSVLGESDEVYSRSVLGGSAEDYGRSVLGESDEVYSRSVLGGSEEYFSISLLGGSDEVHEIHCEPCKKDGNTVDAVKHCVDCAEYLCRQCFKSHAKFKAFQNHVTNDVNIVNPVTKTNSKITTRTKRDTLSGRQIDPKTDQQISRRFNMKSSTGTNRNVTAKLVSSIDVRSSSDKKSPYICDLTIVGSHYCVVTDDNNKSVMVVDTRQMCVVSEAHISDTYELYAITSVNDDQVAVSVRIKGVAKQLVFFSVSTSGIISHTDRSLDMKSICLGVIHHKDRFYGSLYNSIHIISLSGQILKQIRNNSFGLLQGIALSNDHNTIYVCSIDTDTVFSVDLEGNIKATYKDQELKNPVGVTVDSEGYVYVCSYGTHCVHKLTVDLDKVQVIISGVGVNRCTLNRADSRLYVSFCEMIKMYDMKN